MAKVVNSRPCGDSSHVLLTIDPGANSGWAVFDEGRLADCGMVCSPRTEPLPLPTMLRFERVVIEHPMIYPHGRTRNPNDVLKVAIIAGEWAGFYCHSGAEVSYVMPRAWKGTVDPDVCNARAHAALDAGERAIYDEAVKGIAEGKRHNVLDAIGIGLFMLKRWAQ
ncbi:MAG: hypothetical protein FWD69_10440 [Polyangiaceae bacterium]|nr:hypothetical protein [Polyangiaceae bacterium]